VSNACLNVSCKCLHPIHVRHGNNIIPEISVLHSFSFSFPATIVLVTFCFLSHFVSLPLFSFLNPLFVSHLLHGAAYLCTVRFHEPYFNHFLSSQCSSQLYQEHCLKIHHSRPTMLEEAYRFSTFNQTKGTRCSCSIKNNPIKMAMINL
jgi:hypothetical protein